MYICTSSLRVRHFKHLNFSAEHASRRFCDCPALDGETELDQLRRYWALSGQLTPDEENENSMEELANIAYKLNMYANIQNKSAIGDLVNYNFHVSSPHKAFNKEGYEVMKVYIHERWKEQNTRGGTTFKIIMRGEHARNACGYRDFFNGTYLACCLLRENFNTIDIYVMNVNFLSYQLYYSMHHLIDTFTVESNRPCVATNGEIHSPEGFKMFHEAIMRKHSEKDDIDDRIIEEQCTNDDGYWLKYVGRQSWRYVKNGQYTPHLSTKDVDKCFKEKFSDSVIFVGDSHMRTAFLYVLHDIRRFRDLGEMSNENKEDFVMRAANQTYIRSTYEDTLKERLHSILTNVTERPNDFPENTLLVLNSGCWDLAFDSAVDYILEFNGVLELIDELQYTGRFTIVWVEIPPWPHVLEHHFGRHLNSYIIGAVNAWVVDQLRYMGIYTVPMWQYTLAFEDAWTSICTVHYLCPVDVLESAGDQGKEVVQDILRYACLDAF